MTGSIIYNGEKVILSPGTMKLDRGLEVTLECKDVTEVAEFAVLKLKNTSMENTHQIRQPKTLDLHVDTEQMPLYHSLHGDSNGANSFMPLDFEVKEDWHEEPLGGRSSNTTGFPYFDISWGENSMVLAIGWTGQWSKDILKDEDGFTVQVGLCDADFYLKPGEEVRLPSVLIVHGQEPAGTRRVFRNVIREHFSPKKYLGEKMQVPTAIQCFDRYFTYEQSCMENDNWATEKGQIRTIEATKKLQYINTLWLDAAWFEKGFPCGVGTFRFHSGFPNGLKGVSDYAHELGMKFVLWFEPERVHVESDLGKQPDKLLAGEEQPGTRLYNLGDPEARTWLEQKLISLIRENGVDIYRQDFNMEPLPYWRRNDEPDRKGITEIKYVMGMYHMWDTLLAEFPELMIDNCASGGRRLDLETAMRSITLWRSDTGCWPESEERRVTIWNNNQILGLAEYLPYHACAIWDTDAYTVRSTQTHGLACNFDIFNPDFDFEQARAVLKEAREMGSYWDGDFYPLATPSLEENIWAAYQLAFEDKGAVYVFRQEKNETEMMTYQLNQMDPDAMYDVEFVDEHFNSTYASYSGQDLLSGIAVMIPEKRHSLIIKYNKKS
ncbi:MAG: alpha-galactosidase [Roseburia sp.]|nr:alpha-galactosidase [Roseburia sp.]